MPTAQLKEIGRVGGYVHTQLRAHFKTAISNFLIEGRVRTCSFTKQESRVHFSGRDRAIQNSF